MNSQNNEQSSVLVQKVIGFYLLSAYCQFTKAVDHCVNCMRCLYRFDTHVVICFLCHISAQSVKLVSHVRQKPRQEAKLSLG